MKIVLSLGKRLARCAAACAIAMPGLTATQPAQAAELPIVVHHVGPLTGVLAGSNQESIDGARLYLGGVNARGGVNGRPVTIETIDDRQDPKLTTEITGDLLASKRLLALFMPRTTPSTEALLPLAAAAGIPVVAPQTGASFLYSPPRREVFPLRASYRKEAESAIRLQHSIGARKFGVMVADDAFGADTMVGVESAMNELRVQPVAVVKVDTRNPDVGPVVSQMLSTQPEVVLLVASSKAASEFIKTYRARQGFATFISLSNTSSHDYVKALGDQGRGAIVMQVYPSPFSATTQVARDYVATSSARQLPVSYAGLQGFLAAKLLVKGLERAGAAPTPASLAKGLESLGEVDLGGYFVRYGPGDRTSSNFVESTIIKGDGRFMR